MKLLAWIIAVLLLLSSTSDVRSADESLDAKRRFVAAGMRAERGKLRSGRVEMLGEHSSPSVECPEFRVPVRFLSLFDHEQSRFRHETRDYRPMIGTPLRSKRLDDAKVNLNLPHGVTPTGKEWFSGEIGGTIVHTPEYSLFRSCGTSVIDRLPSGTVGYTAVREIDVRTFGLTDHIMFDTGTHFDKCVDLFESKYSTATISIQEGDISHFSFNFNEEVLWELWVDEVHGMTPIRSVRTELQGVPRESCRSEVTWQSVQDVWVPVTFTIRMSSLSSKDQEISLTMNWDSVNQLIDEQHFTARGLAHADPDIKVVADTRLGQVVIEPAIPSSMPLTMPLTFSTSPTLKDVRSKHSFRLGWIILANAIAGGGAWWFFRRRAKSQAP